MSEATNTPVPSSKWKLVRLVALLVVCGIGTYLIQRYLKANAHARCMDEAQAAVETYLREHPSLDSGEYQGMTGTGFDYPVFFSPAGFYLSAYRTVHCANGAWEVRIIVYPTGANSAISVAPEPNNARWYTVHHPRLTN